MTLREIVTSLGAHPMEVGITLGALPIAVLLLRLLHGREGGSKSPWRYLYSGVLYGASVPGMFAAMLCAYALLFTRENLLDQNMLVYLAPIVSMFVTLMLASKFVRLAEVPGFDRVVGMMVLLGISFLIILLLSRLHFFVGFFGNIFMMLSLGFFLYLLLRWGAGRLFRGSDEPKEKPPRLSL